MPKPQQTYRVTHGKTKIVEDAKSAKGKLARQEEDDRGPLFEKILARNKLDGSGLTKMIDLLDAVKKKAEEEFDNTLAGKLNKVVEVVKRLGEDVVKERKTFAELSVPANPVIHAPQLTAASPLEAILAVLAACQVFLRMCQKIRKKL